jgi:cellulose synthase/poly-beta-1,6-N-acetylglucosamine synthase-like glycosyltransferase
LVSPFLSSDETVAVGGTIRLANDASWKNGHVSELHAPRSQLVGAQAAEYARSFLVGRIAWGPLGGNLIISGAFGLFRRSSLLDVGGYEHESIGEDMELIVRLRRHGYETGKIARVEIAPDPVAYTEAPTSLRTLARQRNRWFRGLLDVLSRHRVMIGRPKYGSAGMLALPYFVVVEALAPIIEACGIVAIAIALSWGIIGWESLLPVALVYLVGVGASLLVLILDDLAFGTYRHTSDRLRMVGHVFFEQLIFRPMTIVWRLWGLRLFLQGRTEWGAQERQGFTERTAAA